VTALTSRDNYRILSLEDGTTLATSSLIIASGVSYRTLDLPEAGAYHGAGFFYGSSAHDARRYEGQDVVLVGAANSAGQSALHLARFANRVVMVVRGDSIRARMSSYLVDQIEATPEIEPRFHSHLTGIRGEGHVEAVEVTGPGGETEWLPTAAVFVMIGAAPHTDWLEGTIARDEAGFLLVGPEVVAARRWTEKRAPFSLETSLPGVFAAGDVRSGSLKRVASAVGEGAMAVHYVHKYLGL
jgi:thioredoxin reductase (NADPH)